MDVSIVAGRAARRHPASLEQRPSKTARMLSLKSRAFMTIGVMVLDAFVAGVGVREGDRISRHAIRTGATRFIQFLPERSAISLFESSWAHANVSMDCGDWNPVSETEN